MDKKASRLRRARQTRAKIAQLGLINGISRLAVHRSNLHIYASIISGDGSKFGERVDARSRSPKGLAGKGGNTAAAAAVGSVWPRKLRALASSRLRSTARVSVITAA